MKIFSLKIFSWFFLSKKVFKIFENKKKILQKNLIKKFFPNFQAHSLWKVKILRIVFRRIFSIVLKHESLNKKLYQKAISGFNSLIEIKSTNILETISLIPNQTTSMYFTFSTINQCLSLYFVLQKFETFSSQKIPLFRSKSFFRKTNRAENSF